MPQAQQDHFIHQQAKALYVQSVLDSQHCVAALLESYRTSHEKTPSESWDQFLRRCSEQDFEDGKEGCCFPTFWESAMEQSKAGAIYPNVYREAAFKFFHSNDVQIEGNAPISAPEGDADNPADGVFVQSWTYVSNEEVIEYLNTYLHEETALDGDQVRAFFQSLVERAHEHGIDLSPDQFGCDSRENCRVLFDKLGGQVAYEQLVSALEAYQPQERQRPRPR